MNEYQAMGYSNRRHYLSTLAGEYGLPIEKFCSWLMTWPSTKTSDGLLVEIEDYIDEMEDYDEKIDYVQLGDPATFTDEDAQEGVRKENRAALPMALQDWRVESAGPATPEEIELMRQSQQWLVRTAERYMDGSKNIFVKHTDGRMIGIVRARV